MNSRLSAFLPATLIFASLTVSDLVQTPAVEPAFQTAKVTRGDLRVVIRATGTIEPAEVMDVNAQVPGRIVSFGEDPNSKGKSIDYGSKIARDQLLATIDDAVYRARLEEEQASLQIAEAKLELAKVKMQAAAAESGRIQALQKTATVSQADADAVKSNELVTKAGLDIAVAELAKQKAAFRLAQINLDATRIKSPIDGILIDRRVNVGQTVVASLNAPSLFLIAGDLKKMQIWASVNEADIAQIQVGQPVEFTVEAFPKQTFKGKVTQVRLNAQMTQNVVTYTVVIGIDNPGEKLLPYMTANLQFDVAQREAVILVPNRGLRWRPQAEWIAPDARNRPVNGQKSKAPRVWVADGKFVRPVDVQLGVSDGNQAEITGGDLKEGQEIVVGEATATPFVPKDSRTNMDEAWERAIRKTVQNDPALRRSLEDSARMTQQAIDRMGTNLLQVMPGAPASRGGLSFAGVMITTTLSVGDAEEIGRQCPAVIESVPIVRARAQLIYSDRNWVPMMIYGTTPAFLIARSWEELAEGEMFSDRDIAANQNVCVIGQTVKRGLFGDESAAGKEIHIGDQRFRIVGVLSRKGPNSVGIDQDDTVLAPWTTVKSRFGPISPGASQKSADSTAGPVDQILVKAASRDEVPTAIAQITELLRQRHRIKPGDADDFSVRDPTEANNLIQSLRNMLVPDVRPPK